MKRQVRSSVFETNSSSMHSLVVMKMNEYFTKEELEEEFSYLSDDKKTGEKDCVWDIWNEDNLYFGRSPFQVLGTFKSKWTYAMASLVIEYNDEKYKELLDIAVRNVPNLKKIKLPTTGDSIPDKDDKQNADRKYAKEYGKTEDELIVYLKGKEILWDLDEEIEYWKDRYGDWRFNSPYTGSVDENILSGFLEEEGISLEEFIMNKKYVVVVDGDEYCVWDDCKDFGLVNKAAIDHEYP